MRKWRATRIERLCSVMGWWWRTVSPWQSGLSSKARGKMSKRALNWSRAASIGWRDLKSAPGKFAFVVVSVAVGVAALVGVRGLSDNFRSTLLGQARSLMAADLSARIFHEPTSEELGKVAALKSGNSI